MLLAPTGKSVVRAAYVVMTTNVRQMLMMTVSAMMRIPIVIPMASSSIVEGLRRIVDGALCRKSSMAVTPMFALHGLIAGPMVPRAVKKTETAPRTSFVVRCKMHLVESACHFRPKARGVVVLCLHGLSDVVTRV